MAESIPGFLRIALETRLQIYKIALDQTLGFHPQHYLSISAVSKQIRREVLGIILSNSKFFQSLDRLASWTARAPPDLLPLVSNVSIHIFKESLQPIADAPRTCLSSSKSCDVTTAEWWEAEYARRAPKLEEDPPGPSWMASFLDCLQIAEQKPEKIVDPPITSAWKAFTAISQVRKIWLVISDGRYPRPERRFDIEQQLLLDMMGAIFTNLQELTVFSNLLSLQYIGKFQDLRTLRFTGYSTSTPAETADILCSLKNLDKVIIYRYPDQYDRDHSIVTSTLPRYLSLTPEVVEKLNPLKMFEVQHMTPEVPSQHITIPVIKALRTHIDSLRSLTLASDESLDLDVVNSIIHSTASSRLKDLHVRLNSRLLIDHLDLSMVLPRTIKYGEASLEQNPNPRIRFEHLCCLTVSSSSSCLSNTKGGKICVSYEQVFLW